MRRYLTEFIGTFFLVFVICLTVRSSTEFAPLAIGGVLAVMVFAGGHISGAHYNPAVTVAVWLRGALPARDIVPYVVSQTLGAVSAATVTVTLLGGRPATAFALTGRAQWVALMAELLATFALAYVVLNVATSKNHPDNSFYGLAIGTTVLSGAVAVGWLSGGVFNPAVAVGVSTAGMISWSMLWVYLAANLTGGVLAAAAFRYLNPGEYAPEPVAAAPAAAEPVASEPVAPEQRINVDGPRYKPNREATGLPMPTPTPGMAPGSGTVSSAVNEVTSDSTYA